MRRFYLTLIIVVSLFSSCKSYKKVVYVQDAGQAVSLSAEVQESVPAPMIKNGDQLMITINTPSPEAALPFNPPLVPDPTLAVSQPGRMNSQMALLTYLVDTQGEINFPVLGKIKVAGLDKNQLESLIRGQIYPRYLKENPMVTVRFMNFKVSVLGEVSRPGSFAVSNERISILDALSQAGDMTLYGRRDNVLLIREDAQGKRTNYRIDLTDKNLISSPYYFLQQNDVLYVQPNKQRARGSAFGAAETISISVVGTLISVVSLIATLTR